MRFGRHVELILTDFHSYTMEDPTSRNEANAFSLEAFPEFFPLEAMQILDAGRTLFAVVGSKRASPCVTTVR